MIRRTRVHRGPIELVVRALGDTKDSGESLAQLVETDALESPFFVLPEITGSAPAEDDLKEAN
jgi:hypothetical protein